MTSSLAEKRTFTADEAPIIACPIEAGGIRSRLLQSGSGSDTIVFLHGAGSRADRWRHTLPALAAAGYRCLAIDLPGHGFAQKGEDISYGVSAFADFVEAVLDIFAGDRVHLVGTSLGAHTAGEILLRGPERIRSLTLFGATGLFAAGSSVRNAIAESISDQTEEGIRNKLRRVMYDERLVSDALVQEEWTVNNSPGAVAGFVKLAAYFRDQVDEDIIGARIAALSSPCPMLLIWGEEDRSVPIEIGEKAAALLGLKLVRIPAAAHAPYYERPDVVNPILLRFLATEAKQDAGLDRHPLIGSPSA